MKVTKKSLRKMDFCNFLFIKQKQITKLDIFLNLFSSTYFVNLLKKVPFSQIPHTKLNQDIEAKHDQTEIYKAYQRLFSAIFNVRSVPISHKKIIFLESYLTRI